MATTVKVLLLSRGHDLGTGLISIREFEDDMIEISPDILSYLDQSSSSAVNKSYIIKDNVTYRIQKTYYDMDNDCMVLIAKYDVEPADDYRES